MHALQAAIDACKSAMHACQGDGKSDGAEPAGNRATAVDHEGNTGPYHQLSPPMIRRD
jgi:hypothetical protein